VPGKPELDWWDDEPLGTPGNRQLDRVARGLSQWLKHEYDATARPLPYQPAQGGVFLKDAAALAGLGVMGRNNLLITPEHGPLVRLRALFLDVALGSTGPSGFAPCERCAMPCRTACPQGAFVTGAYDVTRCRLQMEIDEAARVTLASSQSDARPAQVIKYCRACELACIYSPA
jgi:epoxyqueuosine reductase